MKYKVIVHKRAARYLKSLPEFQRQRIKQSLKELEDGITDNVDVKSMVGECNRWFGVPSPRTQNENWRYSSYFLDRS
jgi:hypothetical protein